MLKPYCIIAEQLGSSVSSGENRAKEAIVAALDSPLLNDNYWLPKRIVLIVSGTNEITIDEWRNQ
jgi:cell division protein FtsZ